MSTRKLRIEYVPVADNRYWDKNPKKHDIPQLIESLKLYGFQDPPKFDESLNGGRGGLVYGNGRTTALHRMWKSGKYDAPSGIIEEEDGSWLMPIVFGNDFTDEELAVRFAIDHNNLTLGGSDLDVGDMSRLWEESLYLELLGSLGQPTLTVSADDLDLLLELESWKLIETDDEKIPGYSGAEAETIYIVRLKSQRIHHFDEMMTAVRKLIEENKWEIEIDA